MKFRAAYMITAIIAVAACTRVAAQNACLYIQGDKTTPIYVKVNGVMQHRYGKNYCIAPKLPAGKLAVEILFQQNAHPAQSFVIDMAGNGLKGYIVTREGEHFSLYDPISKTTLTPDNNK